jgi:hypothetical protein
MRGLYKVDEKTSNFGRFVDSLNMYNYIRMSGRMGINSIGDIFRPAFVHGLGNYMSNGIIPLMTNLEAVRPAIAEAKAMGLISERGLRHRVMSLMEVGDPMAHHTTTENLLRNLSSGATKFNGLALVQDFGDTLGAFVTQRQVVNALQKGGDERYLSYLGLGPRDRRAVKEMLDKHVEWEGGVPIANTHKWENYDAILSYRAAISKDVTSQVVRPGFADKPLFMHTAVGKGFFQFRAFNMAANQRVFLRGLQEGHAALVTNVIGLTTLGMFVSWLKAVGNGADSYDKWKSKLNPGFLIGEGLDNSGFFTMAFDMSNTIEKMTKAGGKAINPLKTPLEIPWGTHGDAESQKTYGQDVLSSIGGPSLGLPTTIMRGLGATIDLGYSGDISKAKGRAIQSMLPFIGSFIGLKEIGQYLNDDSVYRRR